MVLRNGKECCWRILKFFGVQNDFFELSEVKIPQALGTLKVQYFSVAVNCFIEA